MKKLIRLYPAWWRQRYGEEMSRLLDDLAPSSRGARLKVTADLLLGVLDTRLSMSPGAVAGAARAIGLAAGAAVIGWLPVGALIYLSNVVFPSSDDTIPALAGYLYLMTAFLAIGAMVSRICPRSWSWPAAGAAAGVVMAALVTGTFAWVDTSFFGTVSRQPQKIAGFHSSGMTSMRSFVNVSLEHQVVGITILLTALGVVLGTIGAISITGRRLDRLRT